jgi:membrane protease YdiL (CAAX protease family)
VADPPPTPPDPATPHTSAPRWGLGDAVAGLLVGYVLSAIAQTIVLGITGDEVDDAPLWMVAVLQVPFWAGLVGAVVYASRAKGTGDLRADFGVGIRRDDWIGLPAGVLTQWPVVPLLYWPILELFHDLDVEGPARDLTDRAGGALGIVLLVLVVVVGAPIVEELFFRGLVLRSLERRFPAWVALVLTAALFALFHFEGIQTPALFVFGLVAGWLAQRQGRLGAAMLAHAGFNAVTVVVLLATR